MLSFLFLLLSQLHPIHISKTAIDFNSEEKKIQITTYIFVDDFELALETYHGQSLYVTTTKEIDNADALILQYLQSVFQISINNRPAKFSLIGKERSRDYSAVWVYLEIPYPPNISEISISNHLLFELFRDQKNIIKMTYPPQQKVKYLVFDRNHFQETVVMKP